MNFRLDLRKYQTKDQDAKYEFLYSFKKTYKLNDMTVSGGMTELYHRMENDPETQKLYTYLIRGGLSKGTSGRNVFCDTLTTPEFYSECMGQKYQQSKF